MFYKILFLIVIATLALFLRPRVVHQQDLPDIKTYAAGKVLDKFGSGQYPYFNDLIERESHWKSSAQNPHSTAYGLCQTMLSMHKDITSDFKTNPYAQIDWCINYTESRYQNPQKAIQFWDKHKWF